MNPKSNPLELAAEMREVLNTIGAIKGLHYASIVEAALNQANSAIGWMILVDDSLQTEKQQMLVITENIINTQVALMISLWKTSGFNPTTKEDEEAMYADCQATAFSIQKDVKMLQAKQREYNDS